MSFKFNEDVFRDNSFNENIKEKLTSALNKAFHSDATGNTINTNGLDPYDLNNNRHPEKSDILKSEIVVKKVDFPTIPQFEILDLDINTQPRSLVKGMCKIMVKDATVQLQTVIESNLLLVNMKSCPSFVKPKLIENNSLRIPITMTFKEISLEAISNIFVKNNSISISFNDVNLDFNFNCSIKILQTTIEKRLKDSMHLLFKDVLPSVLFNMSQSWFTNNHPNNHAHEINTIEDKVASHTPKVVFDESDLQELSPKTMLRLSTIVSSRHTLSLHGTSGLNSMASIPGCLEKQNLFRFISRMPSLSNYYSAYKTSNNENPIDISQYGNDENILPERVLREKKYDLNKIIEIQNKLYERSTTDENDTPKRRTIKLKRKRKQKPTAAGSVTVESVTETPKKQIATTPKLDGLIITNQRTPVENNQLQLEKIDTGKNIMNVNIDPLKINTCNKTPLLMNKLDDEDENMSDFYNESSISPIKRKISSGSPIPNGITFVGIHNHYNNNGWKWGNEDNTTILPPPPYKQ